MKKWVPVSTANSAPEATTKAAASGILDKNDPDVTSVNGKMINLNFFDNLGYSYTARISMKQSDNTNEYSIGRPHATIAPIVNGQKYLFTIAFARSWKK